MEELAFNQDTYLSEKFLEIKNEYNLNTVIETGTYHGTTTSWFSKHFKDVYTIESQSAHFEEASKIIGHINNIKIYIPKGTSFCFDLGRCIIFSAFSRSVSERYFLTLKARH
jgi:hypothetical protein